MEISKLTYKVLEKKFINKLTYTYYKSFRVGYSSNSKKNRCLNFTIDFDSEVLKYNDK